MSEEPELDDTLVRVSADNRAHWARLTGGLLPLMDHQDAAIDKALARLGHDAASGVVCVPTGGGKTRIGSEIVVSLVAQWGFRVLWLAHKMELVDQAVEALVKVAAGRHEALRVGRYQAGKRKVGERVDVVVASMATINRANNLDRLLASNPRFDLIVVDECHHTVARTWRALVAAVRERFPAARLLGLSATPFRTDRDEDTVLRRIFDDTILHEVGATELIERRVLAQPLFVEVDTEEVLEFAGAMASEDEDLDFTPAQLEQIAQRQARNRLMVDVYLARRGVWGPTVFFACTIRHCEQIAEMLREAGVTRARAVHGDTRRMSREARRQAITDFKEGRLDVLVSAMLLTEGTDLPKTRAVFMARPTRSPILFRQMIGRGLRGPRVGGTNECSVVLFEDTFADHATEGLAGRLAWMAGLEDAGVALQRLEEKALEAALARAQQADPALVEMRRSRRQRMEEALRGLVADAGLIASDEDRRLEGWWELTLDPARPPLVLPYFRGFEPIKRLIEATAVAVREGLTVAQGWAELDLWDAGALAVRAVAFARTALRHRVAPQWVDIEAAEEGRTFERAREGDHPDYEETYHSVGRTMLRKEVSHFVRRQARAIRDWSKPDKELWPAHVTSQEGWARLTKRSEEFYARDEWRAIAAEARAELASYRPEDA